jgi:transcription initiation factor TFIID subunit 2
MTFTLPSLTPLVKHTVAPLTRVFAFFEELLSSRFPYPSYRQLLIDQVFLLEKQKKNIFKYLF